MSIRSVVLVHGAGNGPDVFREWPPRFHGLELTAVDLHAGLDVGRASMNDYCSAVVKASLGLPQPVALCGWSMGGLVVMMAAEAVRPAALVVLEPSPPAETQGYAPPMLQPQRATGCGRPSEALTTAEQ